MIVVYWNEEYNLCVVKDSEQSDGVLSYRKYINRQNTGFDPWGLPSELMYRALIDLGEELHTEQVVIFNETESPIFLEPRMKNFLKQHRKLYYWA